MILLLGKNNLVEKYAKEILNADIDNDMVYYPDEKTHYSELPQWVEILLAISFGICYQIKTCALQALAMIADSKRNCKQNFSFSQIFLHFFL